MRTMLFILVALCWPLYCNSQQWTRAPIIYHHPSRTSNMFKRHVMAIDASGNFNGQWIFDGAILYPSDNPNVVDYYLGADLTEQKIQTSLNDMFSNAGQLDAAIDALSQTWGKPWNYNYVLSIAVPYFNPNLPEITLSAKKYNLKNQQERLSAVIWYIEQVQTRIRSRSSKHVKINRLYHAQESIVDWFGDWSFIPEFNREAHSRGFYTDWVPYYDAPGAWNSSSLGFDIVVVQPRNAFLNSIDGGVLKGDRLYAAGYKAARQGKCIEYELRDYGDLEVSNWLSHQYLAIAAFTGASRYPQAFFFGNPNILDRVDKQKGSSWAAYSAIVQYLKTGSLYNQEMGIPATWLDIDSNRKQVKWTVDTSYMEDLNSIRLDFEDEDEFNPWKGRLEVKIDGSIVVSYSQRAGRDPLDKYSSVFVPMSHTKVPQGSTLVIQLVRFHNSPWPSIHRLVAAKYEPKIIGNPIVGQISTSSISVGSESHLDSQPTHLQYARGKLTDGKIAPWLGWWWGGTVGFNWIEQKFIISIDLEAKQSVRKIRLIGYRDPPSGVDWPKHIVAYASSYCDPQESGVAKHDIWWHVPSCLPQEQTGYVETLVTGSNGALKNGSMTGDFGRDIDARFVTITGVAMGWTLLDEVQVINSNGVVVSTGKPYRIAPTPGYYKDSSDEDRIYPDNSMVLTDGAVFRHWTQSKKMAAGFKSSNGQQHWVQSIWDIGQYINSYRYASIWVTEGNTAFGIIQPSSISMQWRDKNHNWSAAVSAPVVDCGPAPCAKMSIPEGQSVTGVKGILPVSKSWIMVTEISVEY